MKYLLYFFILILVLIILIVLFYVLYPWFGWTLSKQQLNEYSKFDNFSDWKFKNIEDTPTMVQAWDEDTWPMMTRDLPKSPIKVEDIDFDSIEDNDFIWFWHSSFFLKLDWKNILIDPVFSNSISPVPIVPMSRFTNDKDIFSDIIEKLPEIDLVLITHNHYDHLDYNTIKWINKKVENFFIPMWISKDLLRWGINEDKINEFNWEDKTDYKWLEIIFNTARHYSSRNLFDRNQWLWWSWVLKSDDLNLYFSWDSWYWNHFKEIWEKYWPFDYSFIDWGQYNKRWPNIHMFPEESLKAAKDLNSKNFMLIHWWAFTLSSHAWNEPIQLVYENKEDISLVCPKIWETFSLINNDYCNETWWN